MVRCTPQATTSRDCFDLALRLKAEGYHASSCNAGSQAATENGDVGLIEAERLPAHDSQRVHDHEHACSGAAASGLGIVGTHQHVAAHEPQSTPLVWYALPVCLWYDTFHDADHSGGSGISWCANSSTSQRSRCGSKAFASVKSELKRLS